MSSKKKSELNPACAACDIPLETRACRSSAGKAFKGCPTVTGKDILKAAGERYQEPATREFARQASLQEAACYANRHQRPYVMQPTKTRLQEICEFAERLNYRRLGLAFCVGLAREAGVVAEILETHGFRVISILCKAGRIPKEEIGIRDEEKIYQGTEESMCNPIYQALRLNAAKTDFNILLGLCVGHDSLFFRHAEAPTTVLAVKDRVTGHNPLAAVYLSESYYRRLKVPGL